jgi:hypothetical protein
MLRRMSDVQAVIFCQSGVRFVLEGMTPGARWRLAPFGEIMQECLVEESFLPWGNR